MHIFDARLTCLVNVVGRHRFGSGHQGRDGSSAWAAANVENSLSRQKFRIGEDVATKCLTTWPENRPEMERNSKYSLVISKKPFYSENPRNRSHYSSSYKIF